MAFQAIKALAGHYYLNMTLHPEPSIRANKFFISWPKILRKKGREQKTTRTHQLHVTSRV